MKKGWYILKSAREVSAEILSAVLDGGAYSNVVLLRVLQGSGLDRAQKAFVTQVVKGSIRSLFSLDKILAEISSVPLAKMKPFVRAVLRVSVYQMQYMEEPVFAVVNDAVQLIKRRGYGRLAGFVNAVLRKAANLQELPAPSYPDWLMEHFYSELGEEATSALIAANMAEPKVSLCVNTQKTDTYKLKQMLEAEGVRVYSSHLENALEIAGSGDISRLKTYKDGYFHVMDISSMLAVIMADIQPGHRVLDICAAPGGKSYFAAYLQPSASIEARDIHMHKVKLLEKGAMRLGLNLAVKAHDATILDESLISALDVVLVDAPCSGLGVIRKKPEIVYFKSEKDLRSLVGLQRQILDTAQKYVSSDGILLYSTCTLNYAENMGNIEWFLQQYDYRLLEHRQILPQDFGSDGFFMAKLKRN